ncbi:MAG: hypothetical protein ACRCTZ_07985 [Sarcina sp.]
MLVKEIDVEKFKKIRKIMRETNDDILNTKNGYLSQAQIHQLMVQINKFLSYFERREDKELTVPHIIVEYVKMLDEIIDVNQTKI